MMQDSLCDAGFTMYVLDGMLSVSNSGLGRSCSDDHHV